LPKSRSQFDSTQDTVVTGKKQRTTVAGRKQAETMPITTITKPYNNSSCAEGFRDFLPQYVNLSNESTSSGANHNLGNEHDMDQHYDDDDDLDNEPK
jgi:hypothetical protein